MARTAMRRPPNRSPAAALLVALLAIAGYWLKPSSEPAPSEAPTQPPPRAAPRPKPAPPVADEPRTALPPEALETLALIRAGGPFPYDKDGTEFRNREGRLPDRGRGHYREYTVPTPGASTRGARRIVTGADGEFFYTDDHYETFRALTAAELSATAPPR